MELSAVDHLFAESLGGHPFLARLMASAREGHLCLTPEEDPKLPPHLVYEGEVAYPKAPIVHFQNAYYLQRHWAAETEVVHALCRLREAPPTTPLSLSPKEVNREQAHAIKRIATHSLTLLTGGPGTGKTYAAGKLIQEVLKADPTHRIALAAPTGKAVGNLEASLGHLVPAKTLHSLLKRRPGRLRPLETLPADLILVDEASMVDVEMMATLLMAIPSGARLILMGDPHQLPPVESGSLFSDMVAACPKEVAMLKECLRVETATLVELAEQVNQGKGQGLVCRPLSHANLLKELAPRFPNPYVHEANHTHLAELKKFRLLAPIRQGPLGVQGLNTLFHNHFKDQCPPGQSLLTPIMITKNAYPLSLYNGEVGVLVDEEYALFSSKEGDLRRILHHTLPPYELAYCLSVHKSQGSEFDEVAFILSPGAERFGRELFYTALTRAKRSFSLYGSWEVANGMIGCVGRRFSQLKERLA